MAPKAFNLRDTKVALPIPKTGVFHALSGGNNVSSNSVSAIVRYQNDVYFGTPNGHLCKVQSTDSDFNSLSSTNSIVVKISSKPVESIEILPQHDVLLVLSDGRLACRDLATLTNEHVVIKAKCRIFCVNELEHFNHLFCAAIGSEKLVVFEHRRAGNRVVQLRQLHVKGPVLSCAWNGPTICFATGDSYFILDQDYQVINTRISWTSPVTGASNAAQSTSALGASPLRRLAATVKASSPTTGTNSNLSNFGANSSLGEMPFVQSLPVAKFLVFGQGSIGVIIDSKGLPAGGAVAWSSPPVDIAFNDPFLVSLIHVSTIEIHSDQNPQSQFLVVQRIELNQPSILVSAPLWMCVQNRIWRAQRLQATILSDESASMPLSSGTECWSVSQLVCSRKGHLSVLDPIDTNVRIMELFQDGSPSRAFDLLDNVLEMQGDPAERVRIVRYFQVQAGLSLLARHEFEAATTILSQASLDPRELLFYFNELQSPSFEYCARLLVPSDRPTISGSHEPITLRLFSQSQSEVTGSGGDNTEFYPGLLQFLIESRNKFAPDSTDAELVQDIDTISKERDFALLHLAAKCLKMGNDLQTAAIRIFDEMVRDPNLAVDELECQNVLKREGLYHLLAEHFVTSGNVIDAMKIWRGLGTGELDEPGFNGVDATIEYLKSNPNQVDLWEVAKWVFEEHPKLAISIFTSSPVDVRGNAEQILDFLRSIPSYRECWLAVQFLESIVLDVNDKIEDDSQGTQHRATGVVMDVKWANTQLAIEYLSALDALKTSTNHAKVSKLKSNYIHLLRSDVDLDTQQLLESSARLKLQDEHIETLARLGLHDQAIRTMFSGENSDLNSTKAAEEYCVSHYGRSIPSVEGTENPFLVLLRVCCLADETQRRRGSSSNHTVESMDMRVRSLLSKYGSYLNPVETLALISPKVRIVELLPFLRQSLPTTTHKLHQNSIVKALSRANNLRTKYKLMELESKCVVLNDSSECSLCHQPLGNSQFKLQSSDVKRVVHVSCDPKSG